MRLLWCTSSQVPDVLVTHTDSGIPCWDPAVSTASKPREIHSRRLAPHACVNRSLQTPSIITSAVRRRSGNLR